MQSIKHYLLWLALAITLLLVYVIEQQEDVETAGVIAPETTPKQQVKQAQNTPAEADFQLREHIIDRPKNLFAVLQKAEPEIVREQRVPQPAMPVNPYTYAGKLIENGEVKVFLTNGRKNYVVKTGDTLEDTWQIKSIESTEMILLNLPTQKQVSVQIGALL